jgi:hypothetical protein
VEKNNLTMRTPVRVETIRKRSRQLPPEHYIAIAIKAIERAKYSKNYHEDMLMDHLNTASDALDTAIELY